VKRLTWLMAAAGLACAGVSFAGPFPSDFQEAMRLYQTPGKAADAEAAFLALAARDVRDPSGPDALLARANTFEARELGYANLALGNFYRDGARDEDKALAAYEAVAHAAVYGALKYDGVIAYAALLAVRGRGQDALAHLDALQVETIRCPDWQCRIYQTYGTVYAAQNRTADATSAYRKAAAVPGASGELVRAAEKKLAGVSP